jgi:hypothetical protein
VSGRANLCALEKRKIASPHWKSKHDSVVLVTMLAGLPWLTVMSVQELMFASFFFLLT